MMEVDSDDFADLAEDVMGNNSTRRYVMSDYHIPVMLSDCIDGFEYQARRHIC